MRVRIAAAFLVAAIALAGPARFVGGTSDAAKAAPAAGEQAGGVIVKFKPSATLAGVAEALDDSETTATASSGGSKLVFADPAPGQSVDDAVDALNDDPSVDWAEPDLLVTAIATPNDTYYSSQSWHYTQIGLPTAWDIETGSASVIVAVIDTGVLSTHPDLDGKLTSGANAGYDFYNNDSNPNDDNGHGTFVSGIIGAETNNSSWVSGACWACKIMAVKALGADGSGPTSAVISGVDWAVAHGAQVINLSLGSTSPTAGLEIAVNNAYSSGVTVIAASGNSNGAVLWPAAYDNVIAVGANNSAGVRSSFSNYGPELDVMAPGESVVSTIRTSAGGYGYGSGSGTSFASPHVAGVAGLMITKGVTGPATIASRLKSTATDMGSAGFDNLTGYGRINAALAVADTTAPAASITSPAAGTIAGSVAFNATATDAGGMQKVRFWIDSTYLGNDPSSPYSRTLDTTTVLNGKHTLKIEALDLANNSTIKTLVVTVINPDSTPPTVNITAPSDGGPVSGSSVTISANASDTQGLQKVQFWLDTTYLGYDDTAPYSKTFNSTLLVNGTVHAIKARAVDWANNTTDNDITVTVNNSDSTPPTVAISSPSDLDTVSGTITITATASDDVGVQKVQFWVDSTYLGYDSSSPYTRTWDSTTVANGTHVIKVRSVDYANNVSTEVTITVTVNN